VCSPVVCAIERVKIAPASGFPVRRRMCHRWFLLLTVVPVTPLASRITSDVFRVCVPVLVTWSGVRFPHGRC